MRDFMRELFPIAVAFVCGPFLLCEDNDFLRAIGVLFVACGILLAICAGAIWWHKRKLRQLLSGSPKAIIALLSAAIFATPTDATCRVVVKKEVVVKQAVVVEKVAAVAVPVVAVAVQVPYYSAYYAPTPAPVAQPGIADNGELTAAIKELVRRIDALERRGQQPPTMPPATDPPTPGKPTDPFNPTGAAPLRQQSPAFAAACVQCHKPGGTGTGPQGITLFDQAGNWIPGTEGRAMGAVYAGRMPKGGKLTDEQVGDFMAGIDAHLKARKP